MTETTPPWRKRNIAQMELEELGTDVIKVGEINNSCYFYAPPLRFSAETIKDELQPAGKVFTADHN